MRDCPLIVELTLDREDRANNNKETTNYVDSVNSSFTFLLSRKRQVPSEHTHTPTDTHT